MYNKDSGFEIRFLRHLMGPHTMTGASYPKSFFSEHTSLTKNNYFKEIRH